MASQAAQAWAPPAAALPFAVLAVALGDPTGDSVPVRVGVVLGLGYVAGLVAASLAARYGSLVPFGGSVGGFAAGVVLAVPALAWFGAAFDPCDPGVCRNTVPGAVATGLLAAAMALGGRAAARVYGRPQTRKREGEEGATP